MITNVRGLLDTVLDTVVDSELPSQEKETCFSLLRKIELLAVVRGTLHAQFDPLVSKFALDVMIRVSS